jgi:hypothetical protein
MYKGEKKRHYENAEYRPLSTSIGISDEGWTPGGEKSAVVSVDLSAWGVADTSSAVVERQLSVTTCVVGMQISNSKCNQQAVEKRYKDDLTLPSSMSIGLSSSASCRWLNAVTDSAVVDSAVDDGKASSALTYSLALTYSWEILLAHKKGYISVINLPSSTRLIIAISVLTAAAGTAMGCSP